MNDEYYQQVKAKYDSKGADFSDLFETILSIADEASLDEALACLERCVIEKRTAWLDRNLPVLERTADPIDDAYRIFYEVYLGISAPSDGEIVERAPGRMVTRWWNECPTLDVCQKLGLDTREVCKKAYHEPAQVFLSRIDPRLRFERNYDALRPHAAYCEEIIGLEEE
jgi:hypothetical protein